MCRLLQGMPGLGLSGEGQWQQQKCNSLEGHPWTWQSLVLDGRRRLRLGLGATGRCRAAGGLLALIMQAACLVCFLGPKARGSLVLR